MAHTAYEDITHKILADLEQGIDNATHKPYLKDLLISFKPNRPHHYGVISCPQMPFANAQRFFEYCGIVIRHGGNCASYEVATDIIQMPPIFLFKSPLAYYKTLAHELIHSTQHPARLRRYFGVHVKPQHAMMMEEMIAEIGAAFLCADLNITSEVSPLHAAYIVGCYRSFNSNPDAVLIAANHAQKAAEYLHNLQPAS